MKIWSWQILLRLYIHLRSIDHSFDQIPIGPRSSGWYRNIPRPALPCRLHWLSQHLTGLTQNHRQSPRSCQASCSNSPNTFVWGEISTPFHPRPRSWPQNFANGNGLKHSWQDESRSTRTACHGMTPPPWVPEDTPRHCARSFSLNLLRWTVQISLSPIGGGIAKVFVETRRTQRSGRSRSRDFQRESSVDWWRRYKLDFKGSRWSSAICAKAYKKSGFLAHMSVAHVTSS